MQTRRPAHFEAHKEIFPELEDMHKTTAHERFKNEKKIKHKKENK